MKRARTEGSCPHINIEFSSADYGNIFLQHSSRRSPRASHACCACGQVMSHRYRVAAEGDATGGSLLQSCACGSGLLIDVVRSELYCCSCHDYVYHPTFDEGRQLAHVTTRYVDRGLRPELPHHDPGPDVRAKRARASQDPMAAVLRANAAVAPAAPSKDAAPEPNGSKCVLLGLQADKDTTQPSRPLDPACVLDVPPDGFPAGLRGLNNLGNTCFMNSVLQVFLHLPLMRNYFLGQGHSQSACSKDGKSAGGPCLSCELDAVFTAAYSGNRVPLSPTDFLYSWWTFADSLAGYRQQDAHEFYLSALSGLGAAVISEPAMGHTSTSPTSVPGQSPVSGTVAKAEGGAMWSCPVTEAGAVGRDDGGLDAEIFRLTVPGADSRVAAMPSSQAQSAEPQAAAAMGNGSICGMGSSVAAAADAAVKAGAGSDPGLSSNCKGRVLSLVDAVFGGVLRSDVTCSVCGHTSTAYDPFLDISLDMVAKGPGPPHPPYTSAGSRPPASESPPASSPTLLPKLMDTAEENDTEADGASRGPPAGTAGPSASTCGGRSSLSTLSLPSPSGSLSGLTGGTALGTEEQGEREGAEIQEGRSEREGTWGASPCTGSGGIPDDEDGDEEQPRCDEAAAAAAARADGCKQQSKGRSTASDDSCGPSLGPAATVKAQAALPPPHRATAPRKVWSPPRTLASAAAAVAEEAAAATGPGAPHDSKTAAAPGIETAAGAIEAADGAPPRTTSDSVAAAESAADGCGGRGEAAVFPGNPDDCITSPRVGFGPGANVALPLSMHHRQVLLVSHGDGLDAAGEAALATEQVSRGQASAAAAAASTGQWHDADYGPPPGDPVISRGMTPGASASCADDDVAAARRHQSQEEEGEGEGDASAPLMLQPTPPQSVFPVGALQPPRGVAYGGRRGGGCAGAGGGSGKAPRGRGRGGGGRGRRGGASGRVMAGGAGAVSRGGSGQPGASAAQMLEPQLARGPGTSAHMETGQGIKTTQATAGYGTLQGCLRHFVTPECLSAGEAWICSACNQRQPAVKQLSIRRLPPVLALHVKRFEHRPHQHRHHQQRDLENGQGQLGSSQSAGPYGAPASGQAFGGGAPAGLAHPRPGRHSARKIQTQLQFPVSLDLAPYTTPAILRERYGMRNGQLTPTGDVDSMAGGAVLPSKLPIGNTVVTVKPEPDEGGGAAAPTEGGGNAAGGGGTTPHGGSSNPSCCYQLFAVISHKGDLSGGHYVVFVRPGGSAGGSWYQCDDAWVSAVSEEDVTTCQAYMLFYNAEF